MRKQQQPQQPPPSQVTYTGKPIRTTPDFSMETLKAIFGVLEECTPNSKTTIAKLTTVTSKTIYHICQRKNNFHDPNSL